MRKWLTILTGLPLFLGLSSLSAQELPPLAKQLKPEETAVVFVDFQNNFAATDGEHYPRMKKFFDESKMLENAVALVKRARALGVQVVHVTEAYTPDYREVDWSNPGSFHRSQVLRQSWKIGTRPVELYEPLRAGPGDKDIHFPNRFMASGFGGNGLEAILRGKGIKNVAIGGFTTDICVYATVLSGHDLGFHVYSLKDLIAPGSPELSAMMLKEVYPRWSRVIGHGEFLQMLETARTAKK